MQYQDNLVKDLGADQIPWAVLCFHVPIEPDEIAPVIPAAPQKNMEVTTLER